VKLSGINAETKQLMEFDLADITYTDESVDDSRLTWIMPNNHEPIPILYVTIREALDELSAR
jgi:hypothetical protein